MRATSSVGEAGGSHSVGRRARRAGRGRVCARATGLCAWRCGWRGCYGHCLRLSRRIRPRSPHSPPCGKADASRAVRRDGVGYSGRAAAPRLMHDRGLTCRLLPGRVIRRDGAPQVRECK